jgi:hypothetical protein
MAALADRIRAGLGEKSFYEEDIAQLGQAGQDYLRGLGGQYTGAAEGVYDYDKLIGAKGALGQDIEGVEGRQFSETEMSRIATDQQRARQRALESLKGISNAERTFLTQDRDQVGGLTVGQYTGADLGLTGADSFKSARDKRMKDIEQGIADRANQMNKIYYDAYGQHSGYGYAPMVGDRDAEGYAKAALTGAGAYDEAQLRSLYGAVGDTTHAERQEIYDNQQKLIQERRDLFTAMDDPRSRLTSEEIEQSNIRQAEIEEELKKSGNIGQFTKEQDFLDQFKARQAAVQAMRAGKYGIKNRG